MGQPKYARRKTPAEERPTWIAEDPVLSTEDIALFTSATGSLCSLDRYTAVEPIHSEDAGDRDDLTADVDADVADDMEKEYATTGVAARLA